MMDHELDKVAAETTQLIAQTGTDHLEDIPANAFVLAATDRQTRQLLQGLSDSVAEGFEKALRKMGNNRSQTKTLRDMGIGVTGGGGIAAAVVYMVKLLT